MYSIQSPPFRSFRSNLYHPCDLAVCNRTCIGRLGLALWDFGSPIVGGDFRSAHTLEKNRMIRALKFTVPPGANSRRNAGFRGLTRRGINSSGSSATILVFNSLQTSSGRPNGFASAAIALLIGWSFHFHSMNPSSKKGRRNLSLGRASTQLWLPISNNVPTKESGKLLQTYLLI
jgi:hypothetical protein